MALFGERRLIIKALAASLVAALFAAPALAATPIHVYQLAPVVERGKVIALSVTLTLPADADGETRLRVPSSAAAGRQLWRFIKDPVVTGGTLSATDEKTWVIRSKPRARLIVRYRVISAYDGPPPADSSGFDQPIVGPDGFYVLGRASLVRAQGRDGDRARFVWEPGDSDLKFASDLEHIQKRPGTLDDIGSSTMLAGKDLRILTRKAGKAPLRVAVRGEFGFKDEDFVDMAARVVSSIRAFWGGRGDPFLITMQDLDAPAGWISLHGTGLGDAFAVMSKRGQPLDDYRVFLAHEYFHTWNSQRIGGLVDGPSQPEGYWFSEGFTDYYARRLALRSGLIDLETFAADWNRTLEPYGISPVRTAPNADIVARFWSNDDVHKLPYQRGAQFAVLMEARLKDKGGLDAILLAMRDRAKGNKDGTAWGGSVAGLFPRVVRARTGIDVTPEIERYIIAGEAIILPPDAFGGCLTVETRTRPVFDAGFDLSETRRTRVVSGVVPDGPAYAAGLRNGMQYRGRDRGEDGDGSMEAGYAIRDGGPPTRVIRYMPAGKGTVSIQRIAVPKDLSPQAREACVKAVAGSNSHT